MLSLTLAAMLVPRSAFYFDAVATSHANLSTGSVTARLATSDRLDKTSKKYVLSYRRPSELRLQEFDAKGRLVHDRTVEPSRIVDHDPILEQYTVVMRPADVTTGGALAKLDESIDDLLLAFSEPSSMKVWLDPMATLGSWVVTSGLKGIEAKFSSQGKTISLVAEKGTSRLTSVKMSSSADKIEWSISYGKSVGRLVFVQPEGSYRVPYFDKQTSAPQYASKESKSLAMKVFDAYDGLTSFGYVVKRPDGNTTILLSGKFARQEDEKALWAYDGKTLSFFNKAKKEWYRDELSFTQVIETVPTLGTRVDPTLRLLMTGFNPYRKRFGDGATLRATGSMRLNGEDIALLSSESKNAVITLAVRERDGLVVNSIARANQTGEISTETVDLSFEYFQVPPDAAKKYRLTIPKGVVPRKIPSATKGA